MAKPRNLKQKILELRSQGLSYGAIAKELNCDKGSVCYHIGKGIKEKSYQRTKNRRNSHPFMRKYDDFKENRKYKNIKESKFKWSEILVDKIYDFKTAIGEKPMQEFTVNDVINKIGQNPKCYLTGQEIDITKTRSYEFDHIIPRSRGGDNSLDNLGICTKQANRAKGTMTPDEFIFFCKIVLEHHGYKISAGD